MRLGFSALVFLFALLTAGSAAPYEDHASNTNAAEQAWTVLHEGLSSEKAARRIIAIHALTIMQKDRKAIEFAESALKDRDRRVRAAAAASLGPLDASGSIPALKAALRDREVPVVLAAAHSLFLLKDKTAYDVYYAILMKDRKSSDGLVASQVERFKDPKQLVQIGFEEGIGFVPFGGMGYEAYRQIRKHDASPVRAIAARSLAHDPDKISGDALVQTALVDKSEPVRLAALDALAQRGDPHAIELLQKNLSESHLAVRYRSAAVILHLSSMTAKAHHNTEP